MTAKDIHSYFEKYFGYAEPEIYDNCGFICGNPEAEVSKALICLDVTRAAVGRAAEIGAELIISHHPPIFEPIRNILASDAIGSTLLEAAKHGITIYSAHTNMDGAANGLCAQFADIIGIETAFDLGNGGKFGVMKEEKTLADLAEKIAVKIGDSHIKTAGNLQKRIKKVAVVNGAGGRINEFIDKAIVEGCEAYVSAEFKYSNVLRLIESGVCVIELGHYDSEKHFIESAANALRKKFENVGIEKYYFNPYN